jgi:hypothetical protein
MTLRKDTGPPIWAGGRERKTRKKVRVFYSHRPPKKSTYFAAADSRQAFAFISTRTAADAIRGGEGALQ